MRLWNFDASFKWLVLLLDEIYIIIFANYFLEVLVSRLENVFLFILVLLDFVSFLADKGLRAAPDHYLGHLVFSFGLIAPFAVNIGLPVLLELSFLMNWLLLVTAKLSDSESFLNSRISVGQVSKVLGLLLFLSSFRLFGSPTAFLFARRADKIEIVDVGDSGYVYSHTIKVVPLLAEVTADHLRAFVFRFAQAVQFLL